MIKIIVTIVDRNCTKNEVFHHSLKKRKDSIKTRAERAVLNVDVENQAILEPILLKRASKYKQPKKPAC